MGFKLHEYAKVKGKIELKDKKVITGRFRLSYPALFEEKEYKGKKIGYGISMLFSKDDDISELEVAAHNAAIEKWGSDTSKWPSKKIKSKKTGKIINKCLVEMPFRDGDIEKPDKEEYENMIFVGANNKKNQPGVVGPDKEPLSEGEIKAGDYARASVIAFAYGEDGDTNYGVSFALMNVQKIKNGKGFGGGMSASEEFDEVELDEDELEDMEDEENEDEEESEDEDEDEEEDDRKSSKKSSKKTSKKSYNY